jgi:hypothetical protein
MGIGKVVADWTTLHLARFLATNVATPVLLTGTVALAGFGARISPISLPQSPTYPNSSCHTAWSGADDTLCAIPVSQVAAYPNARCEPSWQQSGTDLCRFEGTDNDHDSK